MVDYKDLLSEMKMFVIMKEAMGDTRFSDIHDMNYKTDRDNIFFTFTGINKTLTIDRNKINKTIKETGNRMAAVEVFANYLNPGA